MPFMTFFIFYDTYYCNLRISAFFEFLLDILLFMGYTHLCNLYDFCMFFEIKTSSHTH